MSQLRIGLTGGVGSGKSTIAEQLRGLGAAIVDADAIVHRLTGPGGAAVDALRREFGAVAIGEDGGLDRARMRTGAFEDANVRRRLEAIVHPMVRAESDRLADSAASGASYAVFVIPLLVESGDWHKRVHRVLVVDCAESTQLERVANRPGINKQIARAILAAQCSRAERLAAADDVVFNEAPLEVVRVSVTYLHDCYLKLSRKAGPLGSV